MAVVVFGSINMDLVVRTPRFPEAGETLIGRTFQTFPGGKGANQAVASARLGAKTIMVGRVGSDVFGEALKAGLRSAGVDDRNVLLEPSSSSGVALIAVEDSSENNIIVVPGANGLVGPEDLARLKTVLKEADILLLQLEVPLDMVIAAAEFAQQAGATVILDPAPAQELPKGIYSLLDIMTPNETEAARLCGFAVDELEDAQRAAAELHDRGAKNVIIKMGSRGVLLSTGGEQCFVEAIQVEAIDTVAAGDAFNGALAAALSRGKSLQEALRWGNAAGALSVTKSGAQTSMPDRDELLAFLAQD